MTKNCADCKHSICIGSDMVTHVAQYECHKFRGKPKYVGRGLCGGTCNYFEHKQGVKK